MKTPIKTCIIGISGYGRLHYDWLIQACNDGLATVSAATVINQDEEVERCAHLRALGCRLFDDYQEMLDALAGEADLCMIPTGTPLHRPMTIAALEAGMHVLVEKPVAGCIEDARAMQVAASRAGKLVVVGYQHIYAPSTLAAKRHLVDGAIGEIQSIKGLAMWPRDHAYYQRNGWAGRRSVDGTTVNDSPFNNGVAHELMMMLFLAGSHVREAATPIMAEAELYRANDIESTDTAGIHVQTEEGVPIHFYATHACRETVNPVIEVTGTDGVLRMTHDHVRITPHHGEAILLPTGGSGASRSAVMPSVLAAIQGQDAPFICDLDLATQQTRVVSMIHEACAIHTVHAEERITAQGTRATYIPGIEKALRRAFENAGPLTLPVAATTYNSSCNREPVLTA